MRRIFNLPQLKQTRRRLRNDRSPAEHILWRYLKGRRLLGYKFRRQHSIGRYIVDFYCPELRLAIEVDGDSHFSELAMTNDRRREMIMRQLCVWTIRVRNDEIRKDVLGVIDILKQKIIQHHPNPSSTEEGACLTIPPTPLR